MNKTCSTRINCPPNPTALLSSTYYNVCWTTHPWRQTHFDLSTPQGWKEMGEGVKTPSISSLQMPFSLIARIRGGSCHCWAIKMSAHRGSTDRVQVRVNCVEQSSISRCIWSKSRQAQVQGPFASHSILPFPQPLSHYRVSSFAFVSLF